MLEDLEGRLDCDVTVVAAKQLYHVMFSQVLEHRRNSGFLNPVGILRHV